MLVAKVGGSLFDLPHLAPALWHWAGTQKQPVLLVPGGGKAADAVRELDRVHRLGEEVSHWLAVRAMTLNAHALAHLLGVEVVADPSRAEMKRKRLCVLDPFTFFRRHDTTPHTWAVTSDSLALSTAMHLEAERLVLLKSVDCGGVPWVVAAGRGWVDGYFPELAERAECEVEAMDFRGWCGFL